MLREKWGIISWLSIPIVIVFLMSFITGGGNQGESRGTLLVTDLDDSFVSNLMVNSLSQGELSSWIGIKKVSTEEAQDIMQSGDASAWLTIQENFADNYLNQQPTTLSLVKNPAQSVIPDLIESALLLFTDAGDYLQQLFSEELATIAAINDSNDLSDLEFTALSLSIRDRIDVFADSLDPLLIELKERPQENDEASASVNFGLLMFPGAIMMALLFSISSLAILIWEDLQSGVLTRLSATSRGLSAYYFGQQWAVLVIFGGIVLLLSVLGGLYFGLPVQQWPLLIIGLLVSGFVMWQILLSLVLLMPTQRSANIVVNAAIFPILMLGGSFFPMEALPDWLAQIGMYFPNGFFLQAIKDALFNQQNYLLSAGLIAVAIIGVFWLINRALLSRLTRQNNR
ncbi:MAG: ABC transporter permease [Proteobacteria bacterium]|nr:ABC transporter permease [Pseudomonadota bacterium]